MVRLATQRRARLRTAANRGIVAWIAAVGAATAIGGALNARGRHIVLPTPPVLGSFAPGPRASLLLPCAVAAVLVAVLPRVSTRISWRSLLIVVPVCSLAWMLALALAEGTDGLTRGPSWHTEYLADVPAVRADPAGFLRTFTDEIARYEIHVRAHPPGMVLLLAGLDRVGLGGAAWEAALVIGAAATAPIAVLLALRSVAGEAVARHAGAFLALTPAAIWMATSADALYMALGAWAVALVILAVQMTGRNRSIVLAVGGGLLGGLTLLGSYGMVLLAAVPAGVIWSHRRSLGHVAMVVGVASSAGATVLLAFVPLGFSWVTGLRATRHEYFILDLDRPYWAFFFINLGAFALALGPATLMGLATMRDRRLLTVVGGGLAAAALANLSGLSSGEVERIWLPFAIWVIPAGAALATSRTSARRALVMQAASAIALVSVVTTQW